MNRPRTRGAEGRPPAPPAGGLPLFHTPMVARYAPGPFLTGTAVTPSEQRWMNARTYIVLDSETGQEYRAVRVLDQAGHFVGYWAVEPLPVALDLGERFDAHRADSIRQFEEARQQKAHDDRRRRRGKLQHP